MMSKPENEDFFGNGFFDWQFHSAAHHEAWNERCYNEEKYWGGFSREPFDSENWRKPAWALCGWQKYGRPVLAPSEGKWDCGHFGGGVHNGSVIVHDGKFWYVYRGESPIPKGLRKNPDCDYICDIGLAVSEDGVHFEKVYDGTPFFRTGEDEVYSFEDVCLVEWEERYYLFCNRWDWDAPEDHSVSGCWLAVSDDLLHWQKRGIVFPDATRTHRNACILQDPHNRAVRVNGRFVMYLNDGLIAFSEDLEHWVSQPVDAAWPGGEGCFALADYNPDDPDAILLFTGGHHTGHFYALGEVLFRKDAPGRPVEWLPRPALCVEPEYPWENGFSADQPPIPVSYWRDTIFFTGMTFYQDKWWAYYGGSEYYTCLAQAGQCPLPLR